MISMRNMTVRTQAVIRLGALAHNVRSVQARLKPGCEVMAVLKGDGYGHGIAGIYPTLHACGIRHYAVAIWEEGAVLRTLGCTDPILILGDTCDDQLPMVITHRLTPTVFSLETAEKLNALAQKAGVKQPIHIKLDTGMHRIGFPADRRAVEAITKIAALPHLEIAGCFTHFAKADEADGKAMGKQLDLYTAVLEALEQSGIRIPMRHVSNSPAILLHPRAQLDAVRAGDILFALCPVDTDIWEKEDFRQVLHWYTQVALVKEVPAGSQIGYGGTHVTTRPTKIATLPIGFADGYSRRLSNLGCVRIHGCDAPILGRVCMDQMMVDVTDIPHVKRGDTVALLDDTMTITRMAELLDCNVDEIVCSISKRVPRVYE